MIKTPISADISWDENLAMPMSFYNYALKTVAIQFEWQVAGKMYLVEPGHSELSFSRSRKGAVRNVVPVQNKSPYLGIGCFSNLHFRNKANSSSYRKKFRFLVKYSLFKHPRNKSALNKLKCSVLKRLSHSIQEEVKSYQKWKGYFY